MGQRDSDAVPVEQLTRFYFQKHFLLNKSKAADLVQVVGLTCGLHAQLSSTPYLSLWNRIEGFRPGMLNDALYKKRALVKTWFMRGTLHIIPSRDLPVYHNALRGMWFGKDGKYVRDVEWLGFERRKRVVHPKILRTLADGPLSRKELGTRVCALLGNSAEAYRQLFSGWGGVLKETSYLGLTVHAEPCGKDACFARLDKWVPDIDLRGLDEEEGRRKLLLRYLRGYSPASIQDFAYWSGLLISEARKTSESIMDRLKEVKIMGSERKLLMLREDFELLSKIDLTEKAPTRLLPRFDSYLVGHKDRGRIIAEEYLKRIYLPNGNMAPSVIVDGCVAGTWDCKKRKNRLKVFVNSFTRFDKVTIAELNEVADELAAFMNIERAEVILSKTAT